MPDDSNLTQAQECIYQYFLQVVKQQHPTEVLAEFSHLVIHCRDTTNAEILNAFYSILLSNQESQFRNTLKRCCYILVNHWELHRHYSQIQALVQVFADESLNKSTISPTLRQLRRWLKRFIQSPDYQDLCLFAFRHGIVTQDDPWIDRYRTYRLVSQAVDPHNPMEQRRAAHIAATRLKQQFKFELAMYTARCQHPYPVRDHPKNPTQLGDDVLWLVKIIVAQQGRFKHQTVANLFLQQMEGVDYQTFKSGLLNYLTYSVESHPFTQVVRSKLEAKLALCYSDREGDSWDDTLLKRTCDFLVDCLTSEDGESPAALFHLFQVQGLPLTLVMVLLKLVLISPASRSHLETRLAELIQHYSVLTMDVCQDFITLMDIFQVTFAICCEDVEYDLVEMRDQNSDRAATVTNLDDYRLFSRWKRQQRQLTPPNL